MIQRIINIWGQPGQFGFRIFIILFVFSFLPVSIVFHNDYTSTRDALEADVSRRMEEIVSHGIMELRNYVEQNKQFATNVLINSESELKQRVLRIQDFEDGSEERNAEIALLNNYLKRYRDSAIAGTRLYVQDGWGRIIGSTEPDVNRLPLRIPYTMDAESAGEAVFFKIAESNFDGMLAGVFPLYDKRPGGGKKNLGSVIMVLPTSEILNKWKNEPGAGRVYLVDNHARLIGDTEVSSKLEYGVKVKTLAARYAARGRKGFLNYDGLKDSKTVGYFSWLDDLNVGVVMEASREEVYGPLIRLRNRGIIIGIGLGILMLAGCFVASRVISQPLSNLLGAIRTRPKDYGVTGQWHIRSNRKDEVGEIAKEFNRLSQTLVENNSRMEQEVTARTLRLHESEKFASLLFNQLPEVIVVYDHQMKITRANTTAKKLFGYHIEGHKCDGLLCGNLSGDNCPVRRSFSSGKSHTYEMKSPHPDVGEIFVIDTFPLRDEDGNISAVVESGMKITERRYLEKQVIHQEKMAALGVLAAGIAHEIGNPLAAISSLIQNMQRGLKETDEQTRDGFSTVRENITRISSILREMSDLTRTTAISDAPRPVNLNDVIRRAISITRYYPEARQVRLSANLDPDIPLLPASEDELLQVLINLFLNALDAVSGLNGERPQQITITSSFIEDRCVRIEVSDNGVGMVPEVQARVFEPFFTTKEVGRGTGLGLSVSYSIVQAMGGNIHSRSELGKGSTFTVEIPFNG